MATEKKIKIGALVYSTNTGLGIQTQEFCNHIPCEKVMLVDISKYNGLQTHHERYPDAFSITNGFPTNEEIDRFLEGLDLVFVAETPLNYYLFERANQLGIVTIQQYNWEFFDYVDRPNLPQPTLFGAPSTWEWDKFMFPDKRRLLQCPVNRERLPAREITSFRNFLHIAGNPAKHDRNGTYNTIRAFNLIEREDVHLTVRVQKPDKLLEQMAGPKVTIECKDFENYWEMYEGFDCMILPRKYGGNCLPMNEALSCGMPVIMTDISPNSDILPMNWLVPATKVGEFTPRPVVDIYEPVGDELLASYILEMAKKPLEDVLVDTDTAKHLGDRLSWDVQKDIYLKLFEELVNANATKINQ